ncbi:hypothetical protein [Amycolatopsis sp. NPDC051716]|uniref:hypothetical protein n=1 Tax=Amycolatopsis sp. NPDC051716 TaxID=3155804 RepID=UPI00342496BC
MPEAEGGCYTGRRPSGPSIGFNATPAARAVATHVVDGPDLRAIIPVLAAQLSSV